MIQKPIQISRLTTLKDIEEAIRLIRDKPGAPLQLPSKLINHRQGAIHDASRLQMLITWARCANGEGVLHFHEANQRENLLKELCDYSPGIGALRLSKGIQVGKEFIERRDALEMARQGMEARNDGKWDLIIHGRCIDLICVSGAHVQYLQSLFVGNKVKKATAMEELMENILQNQNMLPGRAIGTTEIKDLMEGLGIITHEIFDNTQEHATTDFEGVPYVAGHVEGIILNYKDLHKAQFVNDFNGHERLKNFWNRESEEFETTRDGKKITSQKVSCVEISYFDSGPGYVERRTAEKIENFNLNEEKRIVIECFKKYMTSTNNPRRGYGLRNALKAIASLGGLIRVRTGRVALFNEFNSESTHTDDDWLNFSDWSQDEFHKAEGVVISVLIPLKRFKLNIR